MHIIRLRGGWLLSESQPRKIVNLADDQSFLSKLEFRARLRRKFQSPPQRSDSQRSTLCWSESPALLELAYQGQKLDSNARSRSRIELPRGINQHEVEILLEIAPNAIPQFWIEILDEPNQ